MKKNLLALLFFWSCKAALDPFAISLDWVAPFLHLDPIIVEAGARRGEDTLALLFKWPNATIHAFEPVPYLFTELHKNVRYYHSIHSYPLALSNKCGTELLYLCLDNDGAHSLLAPAAALDNVLHFNNQPIEVETVTLDAWAERYNITKIDFLWLDLEGAELLVLKAAPRILETVKAIYLEINFREFRHGTPMYDEVKSWLEARGFKEITINAEYGWQGNALFARE